MPFYDSGWTMDRFIEYLFGPERVLALVSLVEEAERLSARVVEKPADEALRRALRRQMHVLRDTADANNWVREGDLAAVLTDLPVTPHEVTLTAQEVRAGLQALQRLVQRRLDHVITLTRLAAA